MNCLTKKKLNEVEMALPQLPLSCVITITHLIANGLVDDIVDENGILFIDVSEHVLESIEEDVLKACEGTVHEVFGVPLVVIAHLWSKPKRSVDGAFWYGPGGRRNTDSVLYVRHTRHDEWEVAEYRHAKSFSDDPKREPGNWLVITRWVKAYSFRHAASVGTNLISERGGDESWEDDLP